MNIPSQKFDTTKYYDSKVLAKHIWGHIVDDLLKFKNISSDPHRFNDLLTDYDALLAFCWDDDCNAALLSVILPEFITRWKQKTTEKNIETFFASWYWLTLEANVTYQIWKEGTTIHVGRIIS